jgi:hypothetical protein
LPDGTLPTGPTISLDKGKRWELVEEAEKDGSLLVQHARDSKHKHRQIEKKVAAIRDRNLAARQGSDESSEESSEGQSEGFKFTTGGGPKGVMISKRRTPGKKGVRQTQMRKKASANGGSKSESGSGSGSGSDSEDISHEVTMLNIEKESQSHINHHAKRARGCDCEYCNPKTADSRSKRKNEFAKQLKDL